MNILVTGAAGFIGMHAALKLLMRGEQVFGVDNLNDYYDPRLKHARLQHLRAFPNFRFVAADIADAGATEQVFNTAKPQRVVHLAAQAGVRYSLTNPHAYIQSNLVGFANMLESCRHHAVEHLVYASSSSVYGANEKVPFSVDDHVDHPVSLYAATKKANELMAHSYSHLYGIPCTGLRFFTVYGPWGRPDMSPWLFTSAILDGKPINVFNNGDMKRDFTFIDDIVEGTLRVLDRVPAAGATVGSTAPYKVYNIGNHEPVALLDFIHTLEEILGVKAQMNMMPMQPGDVPATFADIAELKRDVEFRPSTPLRVGLKQWADWYRSYVGWQS